MISLPPPLLPLPLLSLRPAAAVTAAAIVGDDIYVDCIPTVRVANPMEAFAKIVEFFKKPVRPPAPGIHPNSCISSSAHIGSHSSIGPGVTLEDNVTIGDRCRLMAGVYIGDGCRLGDDVILHPNVTLYAGTTLSDRVTVHSCAVLGSDGFGFRNQNGRHIKNPQLGHVVVESDVEIGANTTIDRSTFHITRIGEGTKIDNLVQIAHNCQIGRHNIIVGQVGIAGSTRTGDHVVIAGQAGLRDHLEIGDGAVVGARAGVMRDVGKGERVVGIPATPERDQFRLQAVIQNLPQLRNQLRDLAKELAVLKQTRRSA